MKNKVIIVTGGSGLIGRELIAHLTRSGAIAINADIDIDTDLSKKQLHCDITSPQSIDQAIELTIEHFGHIDGLVNNAYPRTSDWSAKFEDIPFESWQNNVNMQMNSVFLFCQKITPIMKKQGSGSIVNIASIYGVVGNDFSLYEDFGGTSPAAYSAIKGGIINFTRYLASYYGKHNIRFNCVSPGGIFDNQHPSFVEKYNTKVPMGRMGNPDDIAPAVSFMLSDDAKYITGQNLIVDGGWTAI